MFSFCTRLAGTLLGDIAVLALTDTTAQGQAVPSDSAIRAILRERVDGGNVTRDGDLLYGQATGQSRFPLTAAAANRFVFPLLGIEVVFDTSETGSARGLTFRQEGMTMTA
ncbi:MAG: hypothetical protein JWM95_1186, partial [Gemmatimonadetes bacterium]|nr:hypothetical protein [Gemmatimonadota bacterium]